MSNAKVLLVGLDPSVVNFERWPGLTAEKLEAGPADSVDAVKRWT